MKQWITNSIVKWKKAAQAHLGEPYPKSLCPHTVAVSPVTIKAWTLLFFLAQRGTSFVDFQIRFSLVHPPGLSLPPKDFCIFSIRNNRTYEETS